MASYMIDGSDLTDVADAIRLRGNTSQLLAFPKEFVDSIKQIPYNSQPSGTITITENTEEGEPLDVLNYANAVVNVPGIVPTGTIEITENTEEGAPLDVSTFEYAEVNVPGIVPTETTYINHNGSYDVTYCNEAVVNVDTINPTGTKVINVTENDITITENITYFENVEVNVDVSVGDFSAYTYTDIQPSNRQEISLVNPLGVVPKLVTVEALTEPASRKLNYGVFTSFIGGMTVNYNQSYSQWYCWYPVAETGTSYRVYSLSASTIIINAANNSVTSQVNNWDTDVVYRVKIYA